MKKLSDEAFINVAGVFFFGIMITAIVVILIIIEPK